MTERATNPERGRYISDSKNCETPMDLNTRSQIMALQNAQVNQSMDIKKINSSIDNIQSMLGQLLNKPTRLPTQERQPDFPIPSIEGSHDKRSHFTKGVPDLPKLSDNLEPTYKHQRILILGKLKVNADYFEDEIAYIYYVFNSTSRDAQKYLFPRHDPDSEDLFLTAIEMISYLGTIYINLHQIQEALYAYKQLEMASSQTFSDFKT